MKKVITYGTFDLFHEGHYNLLKRAKALGDYLIVGVTTEHFDEQRGKINIVDPMLERIENVRKTGFADEIIIEDHEGQKIEDIKKYGIDIFTLGSDWKGSFDYLEKYCRVVYLERTPDISSTILRANKFPIVRVGVVGTGRIAPRFLSEARYVSGLNIQAAYNPHKESAVSFAKEHALDAFYEEYEDFLRAIDAVYVASPHETHYDYCKKALLAGKHVLCEKPMAFSKADAQELFALAKKRGVVLMEGIKTAYCPGFAELIEVAKSGIIGDVVDVEACFSRLTDARMREMVDTDFGGAFMEFGSYTVLPILKLLGLSYRDVEINSIQAENGVDLYSKIQFRYDKGFAMSKTGIGVKSEGQLLIAGTGGYILAESPWWLTRKFQVRFEDSNHVETHTPRFVGDGLRYEISDFVSKINGRNRSSKLSEEESIAMADVVERFLAKRCDWRKRIEKSNQSTDVKIWAHRGCSFRYPENTLAAFKEACLLPGITGIELDVQLTKDGEVVVFHDETTNRLMNQDGNVRDFTLQELQGLRFREWEEKDRTQTAVGTGSMRIPTLREVFKLVKPYSLRYGVKINVELKNSIYPYAGMEEKVMALADEFDMQPYLVFSSFNPESICKIKKNWPEAEAGILSYENDSCVDFAREHPCDALHPNVQTMKPGKEYPNMPIRVWNSVEPFFAQLRAKPLFDLKKLREKGITDLITNLPEQYL